MVGTSQPTTRRIIMEAYKVAGGALAGIGAIAALPIMGPIGAVSLVGAIVGGTLGGVAGAVVSEMEEEEATLKRRRSEEEMEESDSNPWIDALNGLNDKLEESSFDGLVVMFYAMGQCARRIGGITIFSPDWVRDIREMIDELECSEKVRKEVEELSEKPVTLNRVVETTMQLTLEAKAQAAILLDELIPTEESSKVTNSLSSDSMEVVELVKSLIQQESTGEQ
jgi:hypothetical protein